MNRPLPVALLLIASGGFMDAFTYIAYGHVFTNAQSGNVVLFAVYAAQREWEQTLKHIPPMLAFFPGIFAARWLAATRPFGRDPSDVAVLVAELAMLALLGAASPLLPPSLVAFGIAFASAMQNTAFKTVDGIAYTSVVTTGNLRSAAEALFDGWSRREAGAFRKARVLGSLCAAFALGALAGAVLTAPYGKAAIAFPIAAIAAALGLCVGEQRAARREATRGGLPRPPPGRSGIVP